MAKKKDYSILILEDNLEKTKGMKDTVVSSVAKFLAAQETGGWDVFHLAYMMYVPNLRLQKLKSGDGNVVQMYSKENVAVGTSSYIISKTGVDAVLNYHKANGYTGEAIPNVMSNLFPESRYAAYPMVFHRAGKVTSLVNPQLDDFRKVMFSPSLYSFWERLMVTTGLENNQLFPGLLVTLGTTLIATVVSTLMQPKVVDDASGDATSVLLSNLGGASSLGLVLVPLFVALWGASLFKAGNTGAGFASTSFDTKSES